MAESERRLQRDFPTYDALTRPAPLDVPAVQKLLRASEALIALLPTEGAQAEYGWIRVITSTASSFHEINGGRPWAEQVERVRKGLDLPDLKGAAERSPDLLFDLRAAHEAYEQLLGPAEPLIGGKQNLIIVPYGVLTSLPFQLLVTREPTIAHGGARLLESYRDAEWLIKHHAVSVLPSIASLRALRGAAQGKRAEKPLIGFGDPIFRRDQVAASESARGKTRGYASYFRGTRPDPKVLAQGLERLPETADELRTVAKRVGAGFDHLHLGLAASETAVKKADLERYRIVYFATHGLIAGEVQGLAEPALVLTLPEQASDSDDGLLTASEVARLIRFPDLTSEELSQALQDTSSPRASRRRWPTALARSRVASSMLIGSSCRRAIPQPATSRAPRLSRASPDHSSMPGRVRCWCRIGVSTRMLPRVSHRGRSRACKGIRPSGVRKHSGGRCSLTSATLPILGTPTPISRVFLVVGEGGASR